ncbi:MAG: hypothetical protein CTR53_06970 [Ferrovibrio sp.]|nr:MAG: hypothetical protein CTR53_06970 [Ferrovibrio sp.]
MSKISKRKIQYKNKLLHYYRYELKVAASDIPEQMFIDDFSWIELSWGSVQLVRNVGAENAAKMFEAWAFKIRKGCFGDFDAERMSCLAVSK